MRIEKLEAAWRRLAVQNPTENSFLEAAVLLCHLGRIYGSNIASLSVINRSIDDIVERVTRLTRSAAP